jgi:hypothetical protein
MAYQNFSDVVLPILGFEIDVSIEKCIVTGINRIVLAL